jgi:hypothetical protein
LDPADLRKVYAALGLRCDVFHQATKEILRDVAKPVPGPAALLGWDFILPINFRPRRFPFGLADDLGKVTGDRFADGYPPSILVIAMRLILAQNCPVAQRPRQPGQGVSFRPPVERAVEFPQDVLGTDAETRELKRFADRVGFLVFDDVSILDL